MRRSDHPIPSSANDFAAETGTSFTGKSLLCTLADSLFRNWLWILALWTIASLAAAAYAYRAPRYYESEMTFLVRNNRAEVVVNPDGSSFMQQRQADVTDAQVSTEIQLLSSRALAAKLLPLNSSSALSEIDREAAISQILKDLAISPVVKSNMIRVRYTNRDPKRVTEVLDRLAAAYLDEHLQLHGNSGSFEFFESQTKEAQKRWKDAQQKVLEFQQTTGVVSAFEQKDLLLRRQIELQTALHQAEADLKETSRRMDSIRPRLIALAPRVNTVARHIPNQYTAERLTTMLTELQNRRTELLSKYRPTERVVIQLDQQIADTTKAIQDATSRVSTEEASDLNPLRQTLENEFIRAEGTEAGLLGRIQSMTTQDQAYHAQLARYDQLQPREQQLQREMKVAEDNYLLYAKRREEARIGQRMDEQKIANVVLSEKARNPVAPKSRLNVVLPLYLMALIVSILLVGLLARLRKTVQTPWDLEAVADAPVLGTVPAHKLDLLPERMRGFS